MAVWVGNYLVLALAAVPQLLIAIACVMHYRSARSGNSIALLVGSAGQLASWIVFESLSLLRVGLVPPTAATPVYFGLAGATGTFFSLVFAIALLLLFRSHVPRAGASDRHVGKDVADPEGQQSPT